MIQNEDKILLSRANNMAIAWAINSLAYSIVYPFIPLYLHTGRGFSMATVSWIFPFMGIGAMLGPLVAGPLVDCLGRRIILIFGPSVRGLLFFLLAFFVYTNSSFISFAIVLMLTSFVGAFFQNASDAYLTDLTPLNKRAKIYSRIRVGTNVGFAIGPMLGAFLARAPFSLLFALTGFLCLAGATFTAYTCPEIRSSRSELETANLPNSKVSVMWQMLKHHQFLYFSFFYFIIMMLASQLYSTMSVYSTQVVGVSKNMLGIIYSMNGATIVFLQIPLTKYFDKFGFNLYPRMIIGVILYGIGYFVLGFASSTIFLMAIVVIITLGEIILIPAAYALVSDMAPSKWVGRYMGVFGLLRGVGYAVGPWIGAQLFTKMTGRPIALWSILSSFALMAIVGFIIIDFTQKQKMNKRS